MTYADYYVTAINVRSSLHSPDFFFFLLSELLIRPNTACHVTEKSSVLKMFHGRETAEKKHFRRKIDRISVCVCF